MDHSKQALLLDQLSGQKVDDAVMKGGFQILCACSRYSQKSYNVQSATLQQPLLPVKAITEPDFMGAIVYVPVERLVLGVKLIAVSDAESGIVDVQFAGKISVCACTNANPYNMLGEYHG